MFAGRGLEGDDDLTPGERIASVRPKNTHLALMPVKNWWNHGVMTPFVTTFLNVATRFSTNLLKFTAIGQS